MVNKMFGNKYMSNQRVINRLDPRVAAVTPHKLNPGNRVIPPRPTNSSRQRQLQSFLRPGREVIDLDEDPEDVIDLGAPRRQRSPPPIFHRPRSTPQRHRSTYVPNPRLYPGPSPKPVQAPIPKPKPVEGRGGSAGKGRRRRRTFRRVVPNSRLYRPAPPRPQPPPLQPRAAWPPPAPARPLDTASRVAFRLNEHLRPRSASKPPPSPVPEQEERSHSPSQRLVVTLPAAGGGDSPAQPYRPTSAHFRNLTSGSSSPAPAARVAPRPPPPPPAMDAGRHSVTPEDRSDGNETLSAPSEFLAEFLSSIMRRQYVEALKYCRLILQYEPQNATARSFYPLLRHKVHAHRRAEKSKTGSGSREVSSEEPSLAEARGGGGGAGVAGVAGGSSSSSERARRADESSGSEAEHEAEESAGSVASQSSLELDSSDLLHSSPSASLSRRTDRTDSVSGGCWESTGSASRSEADDNGNAPPPPSKPIDPGDLENDNASGEPANTKSDSLASLRRLRAQFACSIK